MPDDAVKKSSWFSLIQAAKTQPSKLSDADVLKIRYRYSQGNITQNNLGIEFGVSASCISSIVRGINHKNLIIGDVVSFHRGETSRHAKLNTRQVLEIRSAFEEGMPQRDIGIKYGVAQPTVSSIVHRRTWKHV